MAPKKAPKEKSKNEERQLNVPFKVSWARQPEMSLHEQRLLLRIMEYCQAQINGITVCDETHRVEFCKKTVEITMPIEDVFLSRRVSPSEAEECLVSLRDMKFEYSDDKKWWSCGYIEHPEVHFGKRTMSFGVYQRLWEIIRDYAEGFHKVELQKALNLPTSYAIRFYLLMSENQSKKIIMTVEVMKNWLGIPEDKYKDKSGKHRIDHLEERVIKPSQKSLDENCPYTFTYEKVRENPRNARSRVTGFAFYPVFKPGNEDPELAKKRLIAKIQPSFLLDPMVYDYLKREYGMSGAFMNPRKQKLRQWQELEEDPLMWLSQRRRLAHEAKAGAAHYIFGAICKRIDELLGRDTEAPAVAAAAEAPVTEAETTPAQTIDIDTQIAQKRQMEEIAKGLADMFSAL